MIRCEINGRVVEARVIERGALDTRSGKHLRPILVEYRGERVWVTDDEGDVRKIPGTRGPVRDHNNQDVDDGPYNV